ncbi:SRPBCC domain-containing protein [uncultured Arthrobacter sp.]|uniref:SRPBCC family protein n=1 Tax=uncultured Arthrobacter sp. TaxID=114050 RepID=UPI0026223053|nr:SRPBCC domain-containing protein [uncultured Arthrobacter sp.]
MSKFTRYAATSQSLALAAMEEASRRGLREADLQDLFLALTLSDQHAGHVLRDLGITINAGRAAVEQCQKDQIESLGISASLPPAGDIVVHKTSGYELSKRALALIGRAGDKGTTADAAAVLRELLDEPSGIVTELLERLNTTPGLVIAALDHPSTPLPQDKATRPRRRGESTVINESFVPAPIDEVWALLSEPDRIPEWDPTAGTVENAIAKTASSPATAGNHESNGEKVQAGATWTVYASTTQPDGKPRKVNEKFRRRTLEVLHATPPRRISWFLTYPDSITSPPITRTFDLAPATGGTHLTITMTWAQRQGWQQLLSPVLLPLRRFLTWIMVTQIRNTISRTFR